jgi:hypothetical protein
MAAVTVALALAAAAPAAQAADLLLLDGEQIELQGNQDYGFVYVDGELRLTGDTTINAASVYIGPNAWLRTCYVPAAGDTCTAGRSLTIRSAGNLTVEPSIDLTGHSGPTRPGGSLVLSGTDVAIGGQITTSGTGAPSGGVDIGARGIATSGAITAYGAPVSITAGGNVSVNGDIRAEGAAQVPAPPGRLQGGAPIAISSSGGDVAVRGNVTTWGRDAGAGAGAGGHGADVSLSGGDVRVGNVDTTGGSSVDADAGNPGTIRLAARGALHVLGRLDVSGAGSTSGTPSAGGGIAATAAGPAALAGGAAINGAGAQAGGSPGGRLELEGGSVALGNISAGGGSAGASPTAHDGGAGGTVIVRSHGATSLGSIAAGGGSSPAGAHGGNGGSIAVSGASIAAGQLNTTGGSTNGGPGANGGPVSLDADGSLSLGGALNTSGSSANGDASPPWGGGAAGGVLLRAAEGTLDLGAPVWATGGRGGGSSVAGDTGGAGGPGGAIDLVARTLGPVVSVVADGGDGGDGGQYGDQQGPGGAGGTIHGFTDGPLLDDLKVVQADGGQGDPLGPAGLRIQEASPASLAIAPDGTLSFASRSPGASRFRVLLTPKGGQARVAAETTVTSVALAAPLCVPVEVTVVAVFDGVRFTSNAPAAVGFTRAPKGDQRCGDPPRVATAERRLQRKVRKLRRAHWRLTVPLKVTGAGRVEGTLLAGKGKKAHKVAVAAGTAKAGRLTLRFKLPRAARRPGALKLRLVAIAPDGGRRATRTLPLEVRR